MVPQGCDTRRSRPVRALHAVFPRALAEPDALPWRQVLLTAPQPVGSRPQQPAGPLNHAVKTLPSPSSHHPTPARILQPRTRAGLGPGRAAQDRPRRGPELPPAEPPVPAAAAGARARARGAESRTQAKSAAAARAASAALASRSMRGRSASASGRGRGRGPPADV